MSANGEGRYLVGLVGSGIGTSLSPALHEREAGALGLRYQYRTLDLDDLEVPGASTGTPFRTLVGRPPRTVTSTVIGDVLAAARLSGYDGLNITHPGKQLVLNHLDELSPEAAAVGAVNTVLFNGSSAVGYNTDLSGFARSLGRGLPDVLLDHVVLLGAGGAGAAVAHALLTLGAGRLSVFDTDQRRSDTLAADLSGRFGTDRAHAGRLNHGGSALSDALHHADGLAHATPTGMRGHPGLPLPAELLRSDLWVADVVYRPLDTELLTAARARGCRVLDGGLMVVYQAADALRIFTGREPDVDRMLRHFKALVHTGRQGAHAHR